jgi:hypothetical protein
MKKKRVCATTIVRGARIGFVSQMAEPAGWPDFISEKYTYCAQLQNYPQWLNPKVSLH